MSSRRAVFAAACLGMLTFGIVLTTLGAALPEVINRFGIDKAQAGSLFLLMTFGILAGSLVFGPLVDRYGYKGMLLLGMFLIAAGLKGLSADTIVWLRVAIATVGFGGGIVNGATNALVADISDEGKGASLNLLGVFFGIGAVGVPFVLATLGERFNSSAIISTVGGLVFIPWLYVLAIPFPAPKQPQGFPIAAAGKLTKDPVLLLMGFMLFLESGMEITVGGWTSTFVNEVLSVTPRMALIVLSLYWMGMMLARLVLATALSEAKPTKVLYTCISIGLIAAVVLISTNNLVVAAAGVFLLGVGFSATVPMVLGFVGERYVELSGTAFSLVIAMALLGGMLMPWMTGVLGGRFGMRSSFLIVPVALVILGALLSILSRSLRSPRTA